MDQSETPVNSNRSKEQARRGHPDHLSVVTQGSVTPHDAGIKQDSKVLQAVEKATKEKFIPNIKEAFFTTAIGIIGIGLSYLFFKDDSHATQFTNSVTNLKNVIQQSSNYNVSNASYYQSNYNYTSGYSQPTQFRNRAPSVFDYQKISFPTYESANKVIESLIEQMDVNSYDFLTVANLYEACGLSAQIIEPMNRFGWYDISTSSVYEYYDPESGTTRYRLKMPNAQRVRQ